MFDEYDYRTCRPRDSDGRKRKDRWHTQ